MNTVFNKDAISVDDINLAITSGELIIVLNDSLSYSEAPAMVTEITKHNRARKDGKARYILESVRYDEVEPPCYCGGNANAYYDKSKPLTPEEIANNYSFYPRYKIRLEGV